MGWELACSAGMRLVCPAVRIAALLGRRSGDDEDGGNVVEPGQEPLDRSGRRDAFWFHDDSKLDDGVMNQLSQTVDEPLDPDLVLRVWTSTCTVQSLGRTKHSGTVKR